MITHFKVLSSNKFLKSIYVLSSGSIWAQGITFACSLVITRLYMPEEIGLFTFILSFISIFSGVINARYDVAIVSAPQKDLKGLVQLSFFLALGLSFIITVGFYLYLLQSEKDISLLSYAWICFFLLLISGIVNILNSCNNKAEEYQTIAKVYVIRSILQNIIMIATGAIHCGVWGLLWGQLGGQLFGLKKQSTSLRKANLDLKRIDWKSIQYVWKKYSQQLTYSTPATLINALSYSAISVYVGQKFGMLELGLYGISLRVLGLPLAVFSSNIARVHFRESATEIKSHFNYYHSTLKTIILALLGVVPFTLGLIIVAPTLFKIVFGVEWLQGGIYVQILAPMFGVRFVMGTIGYGFILAQRQSLELCFQIVLFLFLLLGAIVSSFYQTDIKFFLFLISSLYSLVYLVEICSVLYLSRKGCQ